MAQKIRKSLALLLALTMLFGVMSISAFATSEEELPTSKKSAEMLENGNYQVEVRVPGIDGIELHDEIIIMMDGSYSGDDEWNEACNAINAIGQTVLNGSGNTQLTLMAFGMADNIVLEHVKDTDTLASALGELPGTLLYGRSSTNCEAGFTGVQEYIEQHDETLNKAYVIFISDGEVNTDETPRAFDANWQTWTKFGALTVAQVAFEETVLYGENLPAAFTTVFGDRFDGMNHEEILEAAFAAEGGLTEEEFYQFAEQLWTDVYAYSGLTRGKEYPVSDAERAFVKYDKENGTYIQDLFYYTTYKSAYVTYQDRWTRTPQAATELAAMEQVAHLYMVDTNKKTDWMNPENSTDSTKNVVGDNVSFTFNANVGGLTAGLSGVLTDLSITPFNNVVVTDYMSKWVNLDVATLKIVDNSTGEAIWTYAEGWLIDENRPTAKETPVIVELVAPADYPAGGEDVIGNTNGDIYKLTWFVKDGAMLRSDTYSLVYEVSMDTLEENFEYGVDYPTNGNTDLHYTDENDEDQTTVITVPNALAPIVNVILDGTKYLDEELAGGFEFALMQGEEVLQTVISGEDGLFTFAALEYTEAGEYTYQIVEINGGADDISYDETVYTVTVNVVLEDGQLIATVEGADSIVFYNETVIEIPEIDPPLGPPQTGDSITVAIAAALISLMGICFLPKRKHN